MIGQMLVSKQQRTRFFFSSLIERFKFRVNVTKSPHSW